MPHDDLILTQSTKLQLEEDLKRMRTVERPYISAQIKKAREYGDLSENFEYQAARRDQAILNGRIAEIEAMLERATVVADGGSSEKVEVGSTVMLLDVKAGEKVEYIIVDAASADPMNGKISYNSPIGQALMNKKTGEKAEVKLPNGVTVLYEIVDLRYV